MPQAFPTLPIYMNIARLFYSVGLNGTVPGVVLVHSLHGLCWPSGSRRPPSPRSTASRRRPRATSAPGRCTPSPTVTLPAALPGLLASAIFVFLDSLDEFTATYFVGVPDITTMPLMMFNAAMGGNYQIASITALVLLAPSIGFMLLIERFLKADVHRQDRSLTCGSNSWAWARPSTPSSRTLRHWSQQDGFTLLIDCGHSAVAPAWRATPDPELVDAIYVTHRHLDHVLGVPGAIHRWDYDGRRRELLVVATEAVIELVQRMLVLLDVEPTYRVRYAVQPRLDRPVSRRRRDAAR